MPVHYVEQLLDPNQRKRTEKERLICPWSVISPFSPADVRCSAATTREKEVRRLMPASSRARSSNSLSLFWFGFIQDLSKDDGV